MRTLKLEQHWQRRGWLAWLLSPLAWLYALAMRLRYHAYQQRRRRAVIPSLVIGNLSVGGSGKTPLVLAIAAHLRQQGWRPALISRGYRSRMPRYPHLLQPDDQAAQVGDEPRLLAQKSGVPVVIGPNRHADIALVADQANIALLDDGFQHLSLLPDLAILVVDGERGFGNGLCLPAGPLREPVSALQRADAVVINGKGAHSWAGGEGKAPPCFYMSLRATRLYSLDQQQRPIDWLSGQRLHAVAGIGNPARFFQQLRDLGADPIAHPFPDHHAFSAPDFATMHTHPIVMTEKDAVKCQHFALHNAWALAVEAQLPETFWQWLDARLPNK